jgi:hypothetical protein
LELFLSKASAIVIPMRTLKFLVIPIMLLFLLGFVLFLIAQIANLVYLADRYDPLYGDIVLYGLVGLIVGLLSVPLYTYLTLPKAQLPPQTEDPEVIATYRASLVRRYQKNKLLRREKVVVETEKDIPEAVSMLNRHADRVIQYNTVRTFAGTAISQNGMFDSMIVLYFSMNTVYRVSRVYWQRTSLRQLINLYSQIGLIVIGAKLLEDNLDQYLEENIQEFIDELANQGAETTASMGARATKIIPGFGNVVESIVQGTFNGLMVLRIGLITQKYCGATHAINRKAIRRESFIEARKRIFSIVAVPRKEFFSRLNVFGSWFRREKGVDPV